MKKLTITTLLALSTITAFSQKIYVRAGVGYARPQAGQLFDVRRLPYSGSLIGNGNNTTIDIKQASFSAGVRGAAAVGLNLNKHLGVELGVDVGLVPQKVEASSTSNDAQTNTKSILAIEKQAKMPVMLTPSVVIQSGGKINVYARGGVVVPARTKIEEKQTQTIEVFNGASTVSTTDEFTLEYTHKMSLGFSGAMGVKLKAGKKLKVYGEVALLSMSLYTKQAVFTNVVEDGVNTTNQYPSSARTINFVQNGSITLSSRTSSASAIPFSSIGLNVGVQLGL